MQKLYTLGCLALILLLFSCNKPTETQEESNEPTMSESEKRLAKYTSFKLTTDLSKLTEKEKQMIPLLIEVAGLMDNIFWEQAYGDKDALLSSISDEADKAFAKINYGPYDRLDGNKPFIEGVGDKPAGANFYPTDMTKEEFEGAELEGKDDDYTILRRDSAGKLIAIPYYEAYKEEYEKASALLAQAAELAEEPGLKAYLEARSQAFKDNSFVKSDYVWMDMKDNTLDFVVGPIETYEDGLFGRKAAHEAYILIKDKEWSSRLEKYAAFLPELQKGLPVEEKYKATLPGTNSQLNAYDVVYYAGDCNAGSKTIAINLPNAEEIHESKGSRRLQLKNAMQAKFDKILLPIADELIAEEQRKHITFNAFFSNTMFHEVAHGLGIKNTLDGKGTVRDALKEYASTIEEGKADILGIYMVTQLFEKGEIPQGTLEDFYVTFMAGIFRSVRFGVASSHGKANMLRFYFFQEMGAFTRDAETGAYRVNFEKMKEAIAALSAKILMIQGDGDYDGTVKWVAEQGKIGADLQADLDRLNDANIPVDIIFEQGKEALGL